MIFGWPTFKIMCNTVNFRCQIETQARDYRLLRAFSLKLIHALAYYRNGGEMVSVLASNAVYRRLKFRSGQTKDYKIGFCCFSVQHTALRRMSRLVYYPDFMPTRVWRNVYRRTVVPMS